MGGKRVLLVLLLGAQFPLPLFAWLEPDYGVPQVSGSFLGWFEVVDRAWLQAVEQTPRGKEFLEAFRANPAYRREIRLYLEEDLKAFRPADRQWISAAVTPSAPLSDTLDPEWLRAQVRHAMEAGFWGFVVPWYGRESRSDRVLRRLLESSGDSFDMLLAYAFRPSSAEQFVEDILYLTSRFFTHTHYQRVGDDVPILFVTKTALRALSLEEWERAFQQVAELGSYEIWIAAGAPPGFLGRLGSGVAALSPEDWAKEEPWKPMEQEILWAHGNRLAYCALVLPGYLPYHLGAVRKPALPRDVRRFRRWLEAALELEPECVVVHSWNDWRNGTAILPTEEEGDRFLRTLRALALPESPEETDSLSVPEP